MSVILSPHYKKLKYETRIYKSFLRPFGKRSCVVVAFPAAIPEAGFSQIAPQRDICAPALRAVADPFLLFSFSPKNKPVNFRELWHANHLG